MPRKSKKQQDDQSIELPEDRIDQIDKSEPVDEEEKEPKGKISKPSKVEQAPDPEDAPAGDSEQPRPSRDDLLLDVRESLISESQVEEKEPGFFQRIRNRFRKDSPSTVPEAELKPEISVEAEEELSDEIEQKPKKKRSTESKREEEAIQDFFSDLEALADLDFDVSADEIEAEKALETGELVTEPEPELEVAPAPEEVKIPRLPERSDEAPEIDFEEVRGVALEEYDGVAVEPEVENPLREEVRKTVRGLGTLERVVLVLVGVIAVVTMLSAGVYLILDSVTLPTPVPTATIDVGDTIYPIQLELPGGWKFDLGKGSVTDGTWAPQGPEWLVGTEISRWVALPWTLQLEAVLRTLNSNDQIILTMSNYESLVYNVYSIQELTMEQIQAQDSTKPSLLVILFSTEENTDTHWVVTALP